MTEKRLAWNVVTIGFNGRTIEGHYAVDGGMVIVRYGGVEKSAPVGGSSPETIAKMVLRELANEGARDRQ